MLSWKIGLLVFNAWFVISVNNVVKAGLTNFNNREEIASNPQFGYEGTQTWGDSNSGIGIKGRFRLRFRSRNRLELI